MEIGIIAIGHPAHMDIIERHLFLHHLQPEIIFIDQSNSKIQNQEIFPIINVFELIKINPQLQFVNIHEKRNYSKYSSRFKQPAIKHHTKFKKLFFKRKCP